MKEAICLQCGDKGFTNAFVYCVNCLNCAVHRYCLDVIPKSFDEFVRWVCDDCKLELKKPNDAIHCKTSDSTSPECILGASGVGTEKNDIVALKIEEPLNECEKSQSIDACAKPHSIEYAKSTRERYAQSSSNLLQKHKIKEDRVSTDAPPRGFMKIKRSATVVSRRAHEKCNNELEKLTCDSTLSVEVKGNKTSEKKKSNMSSEAKLEEQKNRTVLAQHLEQLKQQTVSEHSIEIRESEFGEDITSASHHWSNFRNVFSKDSTIYPMVSCDVRVEPLKKPIWSGSFNLLNKKDDFLEGLMAHMSDRACQKVHDEACQFQPVLHLEILPKCDVWPKSFTTPKQSAENIALYFFPSDMRSERAFDHLVDEMVQHELALRAEVLNAELLVFTSTQLPLRCWSNFDSPLTHMLICTLIFTVISMLQVPTSFLTSVPFNYIHVRVFITKWDKCQIAGGYLQRRCHQHRPKQSSHGHPVLFSLKHLNLDLLVGFEGKYYLWGVFRQKQNQALHSQTCTMEPRYNSKMLEDSIGDAACSEGKISATMKSFGNRSPLSSLSNCSSYVSHTSST